MLTGEARKSLIRILYAVDLARDALTALDPVDIPDALNLLREARTEVLKLAGQDVAQVYKDRNP